MFDLFCLIHFCRNKLENRQKMCKGCLHYFLFTFRHWGAASSNPIIYNFSINKLIEKSYFLSNSNNVQGMIPQDWKILFSNLKLNLLINETKSQSWYHVLFLSRNEKLPKYKNLYWSVNTIKTSFRALQIKILLFHHWAK